MKKGLIVFLLLWLSAGGTALASPGGTDANGGHYDHSTGLYHYHHGYAAHQHENGICPYTGEKWVLKIPEKPAILAQWEAQKKRTEKEIEEEFPLDPEVIFVNEAPEKDGVNPALPAAGAAAVVGAGAFALSRRRKKQKQVSHAQQKEQLREAQVPVLDPPQKPDDEMPEDTCIGEDGLPWEREAYALYLQRRKEDPMDNAAYTRFSEPKWGRKYSFCTGATGEVLHTLACEDAFLQINAADEKLPKEMCPKCNPVLPDLRFLEKARKAKQAADRSTSEKETA